MRMDPFYPHFFNIVPSSEIGRGGYDRYDDLTGEEGAGWTLVYNPRRVADLDSESDEDYTDEAADVNMQNSALIGCRPDRYNRPRRCDPYDLRMHTIQRTIIEPESLKLVSIHQSVLISHVF